MLANVLRTVLLVGLVGVVGNLMLGLPAWAAETPKPSPESPAPTEPLRAEPLPEGPRYTYPEEYNYYVHPGAAGLVGAQLYVSPRPTPPLVGHTYITYPPLMPHEFLYKHHRVYRTYNAGSGWTKTRARWR